MTEARAETSSLVDFHTCGVCFSGYTEKLRCPKVLRCGHTFCYSCLKSCAENSDTGLTIQCPSCRKVTGCPISTVSTNYQLLQLLSSDKLLEKDDTATVDDLANQLDNLNLNNPETAQVRFDGLLESIEAEFDVLRVRFYEEGLNRRNYAFSNLNGLVTEMRLTFAKVNSMIEHPELHRDVDNDDDANDAFDAGSDSSIDYEFNAMHMPPWMDFERALAHEMMDFGYLASEQSEASAISHFNNANDYCHVCECEIPSGGGSLEIHERGRRHIYNEERLQNPEMPPYPVTEPSNRNNRNRSNSMNQHIPNVSQRSRGRGRGRRGRGAPRRQPIRNDTLNW